MPTLLGLLAMAAFAGLGAWRGALRMIAAFVSLLLAGVLAGPLRFLTAWAVAATGLVPRVFLPLASLVTTGMLLFCVIMLPFELVLRRRQKARLDNGYEPYEPWERYAGAGLGGLWGLCLTVLVLLGLSSIARVDRAMRVANAELEYRAKRRHDEDQRARRFAAITHTRPAPVSLEVELAEVDPHELKVAEPEGALQRIGQDVDHSLFAPLVDRVNPVDEKREELLKNMAVVVGDPVLFDRFQSHPAIARFTGDGRFTALSQDAEIAKAIREGRFRDLMDNEKVGALAQDPQLREELVKIDIDSVLKEVKSRKRIPRRS